MQRCNQGKGCDLCNAFNTTSGPAIPRDKSGPSPYAAAMIRDWLPSLSVPAETEDAR